MALKHLFLILTSFVLHIFAQDLYPNKVPIGPENGYGFSVEYVANYKVLKNLITSESYALVCCNQSIETITGYQAVVNIPLTNVGVDKGLDALSFFELLGVSSNIKSALPSANITSPCFEDITDGPKNTSITIDAIFTSQFNSPKFNKPPYISVSASNDTLTPLQQSAWVIYIGHFFEKEGLGLEIFNKIKATYECHKSNLAHAGSKNIAWTTYDVLTKAWTLRYDSYTQTLIQDAGMKLIGSSDSKTTVYSNLTQLHNVLKHVDYIIDDSAAANFKTEFAYGDWLTAAGFNPNSNTYAFLTSQNVWRTDGLISKTGFSDWPIRHAARADLVVLDVIRMVYNTYVPSYNMTWFRAFAQLDQPTFVSNASHPSCTNTAALVDLGLCLVGSFKPNSTVDTSPQNSTNPNISSGLSTGGKVGVAVGVVAGVAALAVIGTFVYRHRALRNKEGAFYKMNDM